VKLAESVDIEASASTVWGVITDLASYGEWNPFVVAATSSLKPGEAIQMRVKLFASFAQPQTETILEHETGRRLCYGLSRTVAGALQSHRCHSLEVLGDERCRYSSSFELSGWLAPVVERLLGRRLASGFAGNTAGLKARAESFS
jgi:hypothetical protein